MKFIVNVKLVEKRVNKAVGRVMVVKVTTQYKSPGMALAVSISMLPIEARHVADVGPAVTLVSVVAEGKAATMLAPQADGGLQDDIDRRSVSVKAIVESVMARYGSPHSSCRSDQWPVRPLRFTTWGGMGRRTVCPAHCHNAA